MKHLIWIAVGLAAVAVGSIFGRALHPRLPDRSVALVAAAVAQETEATRPATFAERWPDTWASFDERWSAAWGARRIRTIDISKDNKTPASDTLTARDRAISRETVAYEAPVTKPPPAGDVCAVHHMRRVEYDHGRRWRCRR